MGGGGGQCAFFLTPEFFPPGFRSDPIRVRVRYEFDARIAAGDTRAPRDFDDLTIGGSSNQSWSGGSGPSMERESQTPSALS